MNAYTKPFLLVTEGNQDCVFLTRIAKARGLADSFGAECARAANGKCAGEGGFRGHLEGVFAFLQANPGVVEGIIVVRDTDGGADQAFSDAASQIAAAGLPKPSLPLKVKTGTRQQVELGTSVLLLPWHDTLGNLDSLLLQSLGDKFAPELACADAYVRCVDGRIAGWNSGKRDKLRLRALIACLFKKDPGCDLSKIMEDANSPFDFEHPAFRQVGDYLAGFESDLAEAWD